jgi:hypothetical protein
MAAVERGQAEGAQREEDACRDACPGVARDARLAVGEESGPWCKEAAQASVAGHSGVQEEAA